MEEEKQCAWNSEEKLIFFNGLTVGYYQSFRG